MKSPYFLLGLALVCTALWLWMFQDHVSAKIRASRYWFPCWLAFIWLGGQGVIAWFSLYSVLTSDP